MKICPLCGCENKDNYFRCNKCDRTFDEAERERLKVPSEPEPEPLTNCPYCAGELQPDVLKCRHCGEWIDDDYRFEEEKVRKAQIATGAMAKLIGLMIGLALLLPLFLKDCNLHK